MADQEIQNLHRLVLSRDWIGNPSMVFRIAARYGELREQGEALSSHVEFGTIEFWDAFYEYRENVFDVEKETVAAPDDAGDSSSTTVTLKELQVSEIFMQMQEFLHF